MRRLRSPIPRFGQGTVSLRIVSYSQASTGRRSIHFPQRQSARPRWIKFSRRIRRWNRHARGQGTEWAIARIRLLREFRSWARLHAGGGPRKTD